MVGLRPSKCFSATRGSVLSASKDNSQLQACISSLACPVHSLYSRHLKTPDSLVQLLFKVQRNGGGVGSMGKVLGRVPGAGVTLSLLDKAIPPTHTLLMQIPT